MSLVMQNQKKACKDRSWNPLVSAHISFQREQCGHMWLALHNTSLEGINEVDGSDHMVCIGWRPIPSSSVFSPLKENLSNQTGYMPSFCMTVTMIVETYDCIVWLKWILIVFCLVCDNKVMNEESRQINHDECIPGVIQNHQSIHQIQAVSSFSQKKKLSIHSSWCEKESR